MSAYVSSAKYRIFLYYIIHNPFVFASMSNKLWTYVQWKSKLPSTWLCAFIKNSTDIV